MVSISSITVGDVLSGSIISGSKKVDPDAVLPFIIVPLVLLTSTISLAVTILLMSMVVMGVLYVLSRPRKKNRSPFFFSWTVSSVLYMYLVYQFIVLKFFQITVLENFVFVVLTGCTCYFFYKMKTIATKELTGSSKGKEYSPVLTADSHYCQVCQIEVNERVFHSIWWDCCVFRPNYRYFIIGHLCAFGALVVGIDYGLTTTCHPYILFANVVVPQTCEHVYAEFMTALIFVTCVYATGYLIVVILVILHQIFVLVRKFCGLQITRCAKGFDA